MEDVGSMCGVGRGGELVYVGGGGGVGKFFKFLLRCGFGVLFVIGGVAGWGF